MAAHTVPILKKDWFPKKMNRESSTEQYTLLRKIEEILATIEGTLRFSIYLIPTIKSNWMKTLGDTWCSTLPNELLELRCNKEKHRSQKKEF
ncbi:unnamed protein product [Gordionus sp. m RMFG-2023]